MLAAAALVRAGSRLSGTNMVLADDVASGISSLRRGEKVELVTSSYKTPRSAMLQISPEGKIGWEWEGTGSGQGTPTEGDLVSAEDHVDGRIKLVVRLLPAAPATPTRAAAAGSPAVPLTAPAGIPVRRKSSFERVGTEIKRKFSFERAKPKPPQTTPPASPQVAASPKAEEESFGVRIRKTFSFERLKPKPPPSPPTSPSVGKPYEETLYVEVEDEMAVGPLLPAL